MASALLSAAAGRFRATFATVAGQTTTAAILSSSTTSVVGAAARAAAATARQAPDSVVHVNCTMNNVQITVSNLEGQVIARSSGGMMGHKHRARAAPQAAKEAAENAVAKAVAAGYKVSYVEMKGPSRARGMLLRGIQTAGMKVFDIRDVTPMPTNGCRPKSARRL